MTTTNTKTIDVSLDDIYNTDKLQTNFNTQGTFNLEFNTAFGRSEQYDNIQIQTELDTNFLNIKTEPQVLNDAIGIDTLIVSGNGILRSNWILESQIPQISIPVREARQIGEDDTEDIEDLDIILQISDINLSDEVVYEDESESLDYNNVSKVIEYAKQKPLSKEKNVVNIDSRYRNNYFNNTSTSFDYNLPELQLDVTNIHVGNVDIPITHYTISSKLKNNSFLITSNANKINVHSDISSHWRLQMQIGDISSDWLHGTVFEDYSYTSTDISNANDFANGTPNNVSFWHGPETSTINVYDTSIVPIETVTFEVSNDSFDGESNYIQPEDDVSGTMVDFYSDPSNNKCGLGNPSTTRCLFPRSRTIPLLEQSISYYLQPPGVNNWGDPWGAFSNGLVTDSSNNVVLRKNDPYHIRDDGSIKWGQFPLTIDNSSQSLNLDNRSHQHPDPSRTYNGSNVLLPEYGIEHQQLIFPDPSSVPFGNVPYTKTCKSQIQMSNHIRTISKTTTYIKKYSFLKLTNEEWQSNTSFRNGQDNNTFQDIIDASTNPWYDLSSGNDISYASRNWLLHTEINHKGLVKNQDTKNPVNAWFPRGNPNRTDISFENVKYYNGNVVEYPYDCSGIHETTSTTTITKEIHLHSYTFIRLSDGKEMSSNEFVPVNFAWLVKVPDGNYDESWLNPNINERIINDAIGLATPGAIDTNGNFAAIKSPEHYLYLNKFDKFIKNRRYTSSNNSSLRFSGISISDIRYNVDRITKKSVFASETSYIDSSRSNVNIDSIETINFKFLTRTGQSSLRTVTRNNTRFNNGDGIPSGKQYKEMVLMQNVARQPITKVESLPTKMLSSIKFNVDEFGNQDNETNIQHKLGWVLGFRVAEYLL